jgi:hypothetical protein
MGRPVGLAVVVVVAVALVVGLALAVVVVVVAVGVALAVALGLALAVVVVVVAVVVVLAVVVVVVGHGHQLDRVSFLSGYIQAATLMLRGIVKPDNDGAITTAAERAWKATGADTEREELVAQKTVDAPPAGE